MMLKKLLEVNGVSGNEHQVRNIILKEIKKHVKDVNVDKFGNIIAHKKGTGAKVMVAAHMDEIGLMIKSIAKNGNIYLSPIGGIEPYSLVGQKVSIKSKKGRIHGYVTHPDISDGEEPEAENAFAMKHLFVDTGLDKKELKKIGVDTGAFLELVQSPECLGGCKDIIAGKALDDRIGCFVLLELAKKLKKTKSDICYVFTAMEEIGLYGSKISVHKVDPDWAVVVDVTNADDALEHDHVVTKRLGGGPCITIKDAEMISNLCLDDWLKKIARKKKIPLQLEVSDFGTTDALSISFEKGGIPTAVVGVAVRNLHTTIGIAHLQDIHNCIKLLEELLKNPPKVCIG